MRRRLRGLRPPNRVRRRSAAVQRRQDPFMARRSSNAVLVAGDEPSFLGCEKPSEMIALFQPLEMGKRGYFGKTGVITSSLRQGFFVFRSSQRMTKTSMSGKCCER